MKNYFIREGEHKADGLNFGFHKGRIERKVMISSSCWYENVNFDDQINKLFGFSFGVFHHRNSVRFGWTPNKKKGIIDIYAYQYNKGVRKWDLICPVEVGKWYTFGIDVLSEVAFYKVENDMICMPFKKPFSLFGFKLFPYFGGDEKASRTMNIKIKS